MRRLAALALLPLVLVACRDHTVALAFRPDIGSTYRYEVRVHAVSTTTLEGQEPERTDEEVRLIAEHTVLNAGPDGVRVQVLVGEPGTAAQVFLLEFNRSAQLESIESTEGVPADVVGALGLTEIFPGGAGGPPDRRLAPGDAWTVDRRITLPGAQDPSRLRVSGHLAELGRAGDEDVARVDTSTEVPFRGTLATSTGVVVLEGRQHVEQRATYDLDDGAVRSVRATTTGTFDVLVQPPSGTIAESVPGTLEVRVTSRTRRLS